MDEIDDNVRASLSEAIDAEFFRHDERPDGEPIANFDVTAFTLNFQSESVALVSENEDTEEQEEKKTTTVKEFCRMCLCNDRKLSTISPQNRVAFQCVLRQDVTKRTGPRLSQKVCWECNARMTSFRVFRTKAIQTNTLLYSLIRPFMNETLDVSSIDRAGLNLTTSLQTKIFPADHTDYRFVYCKGHLQDITPKNHGSRNNKIHEITLPNLDLSDDDSPIFNYVDSSDEKTLKKEKIYKKVKKKKKHKKLIEKVDRRCKSANEVLNNDIFNIKDLNHEEQMYEINKRQFSSNYKNSGFKCGECFKGFLDEDAYKGHMIRHTDQCGIYSCAICKNHFKKLQALRNHTTSHMQKFSCKRCNYVTFRRHAAKLHEEYHNGTKYVCPHCIENFDKLSTYMSHIRIKHPSDIVCQLCGHSFVSAKGLGLHKKLKHRFDDHQVPTDGPWCTKCDVQFISKEAFEKHAQVSAKHSDEIKSSKPHAGRYNRDQDSNKSHNDAEGKKKRNTCKPEGPIACEQCEMQLPDPLSYYRHFRRMHPDKNRTNYPSMKSKSMCEVCGKMFQSLALLQDHSWTHTDSKQFKCSACDKQFVRKYRLIAHQRVHGATRGKHSCTVCGKSFTTKSNVRRHMVSHTGLKPFKCEMCSKTFKHASEKRVHITYVHLKKPWPKRARGKRRPDTRQNQTEATPMPASDIQRAQIDIQLENTPSYYNN